mmetsp:Transcript_86538/g.264790  ORF Transcript_86538/g.264790 Transcript_86538/m.264790 type:complete len:200 (-) Transcript_86538:510-1109(-)
MKIIIKATTVTAKASVTSFIMPCSVPNTSAVMAQSMPKNMHHEKIMATMLLNCDVMRGTVYGTYAILMASPTPIAIPTDINNKLCQLLWLIKTRVGSPPSPLGNVPPIKRRKLWTKQKDTVKPTTSSSVSWVSSSHFSSYKSRSPSSLKDTRSRKWSVTRPKRKIIIHANKDTSRVDATVRSIICWRVAKALMAAKPVM